MMLLKLMLALLMLAVTPLASQAAVVEVTSIRVAGYELASSVLLCFNPRFNVRSSDMVSRYDNILAGLLAQTQRLGDERTIQLARSMQQAIAEIENLDRSYEYRLPILMNDFLKIHGELDDILARRSMSAGQDGTVVSNRLKINLEAQNLLYQTAIFGSLGVFVMGGSADLVSRLDNEVHADIQKLQALSGSLYPAAQAESIRKLESRYQFMRPHLNDVTESWVPFLVFKYTGDMVSIIDNLGADKSQG